MRLTDSVIIEALEEGKQIRRTGWNDCYGNIRLEGCYTLWDIQEHEAMRADLYELTADDWEVVG